MKLKESVSSVYSDSDSVEHAMLNPRDAESARVFWAFPRRLVWRVHSTYGMVLYGTRYDYQVPLGTSVGTVLSCCLYL